MKLNLNYDYNAIHAQREISMQIVEKMDSEIGDIMVGNINKEIKNLGYAVQISKDRLFDIVRKGLAYEREMEIGGGETE